MKNEVLDDSLYGESIEENYSDNNDPEMTNVDIISHDIDIATTSIDNLSITVTAYIGSFSMSYRQLKNIREKDLILVDPYYQKKVSLRVDDREIGIGEVVTINGDVAIQIMRLWS